MNNVYRIGEILDDYCTHCHLLLDHDVASVVNGEVAKTTCRTCHNTHDYKHAKVPRKPVKKEETKQSLMAQVLRNMPQMPVAPPAPAPRPKRDLWAALGRVNAKKEAGEGDAQ